MALILVADDNPDTLFLLRLSFEIAGYEVVTAETGSQALRQFTARDVDLAVLDVSMPGGTGMAVVTAIRGGDRRPDLPIIMLTAMPPPSGRHRDAVPSWDEYVTKPFNIKALLETVAGLLERRAIVSSHGVPDSAA